MNLVDCLEATLKSCSIMPVEQVMPVKMASLFWVQGSMKVGSLFPGAKLIFVGN